MVTDSDESLSNEVNLPNELNELLKKLQDK